MNPNNKIIIIADADDRQAAEILQVELKNKYEIQSETFYSIEIKIKDISKDNVYISIGGPKINAITEAYWNSNDLKYKDRLTHIAYKDNMAIVFGRWNRKSTFEATKYFIKNYLDGFIKQNQSRFETIVQNAAFIGSRPDLLPNVEQEDQKTQQQDPPLQPDTTPEVINKVEDVQGEYKTKSKHKKEFYNSDGKIWHIKYYDIEKPFSETKGLLYVRYLMLHPNEGFTPYELYERVNKVDYGKLKAITSNQGAKTKTGGASTSKMISFFENEISRLKEQRERLERKAKEEAGFRDDRIIDNYHIEISKVNNKIKEYEELVTPYYNIKTKKRYDPNKQKDTCTKGIQTNMNNFYKNIESKELPDLAKELKRAIKHEDGLFRFNNVDLETHWNVL